MVWDPVATSTPSFSCTMGGDGNSSPFSGQTGQVPFGAMGTNFASPSSGSSCSMPSLFTPRSATDGFVDSFSIATSPTCSCTGAVSSYQNIPLATGFDSQNARRVVTPVADMDGDGKPDVLRYNSDTGEARCYKSSSNFASYTTIATIGEARAVLL